MTKPMRRITTTLGAVLASGMLLLGCATPGSEAGGNSSEPLTIVTWGGTTEEGYKDAFAAPLEEATGHPVQFVNPVDYGKYTAQIESGQVSWDWVDLEAWYVLQNPDYWAPIDKDVVKYDEEDLIQMPGLTRPETDWAMPVSSYSFAISYRTDRDGGHPTSWPEFFDTEKFPGKRAIYNWPYGMLEVALLGDGVPFEELYPLDIDRGLAKLDSIRDDLVFWNSGAELQQIMSSGEAPYGFAWHNRIAAMEKEGVPVTVEWSDNLQDAGYNVTAKNGKHVPEVMELFSLMLDPERQATMSMNTGYSPSLKSSFDFIPQEDHKYYNAYEPNLEQAVGTMDAQWWADNFDEATEKWTSWAGQ